MDKRFFLALALCLVVLVLYPRFFMKTPPKPPPPPPTEAPAEPGAQTPAPGTQPATEPTAPKPVEGAPAPAPAVAEEDKKTVVLENDLLRLVLTNHGATIQSADLLDAFPSAHAKEAGQPHLRLLTASPEPDLLNALRLDDLDRPWARLGESIWEHEKSADGRTVVFRRNVEQRDKSGLLYQVRKEISLPAGAARHVVVRIAYAAPAGNSGKVEALKLRMGLLATGGVFQEVGASAMTGSTRAAIEEVEGKLKLVPCAEVEKKQKEARNQGGAAAALRGVPDTGGERYTLGGSTRYVADLSNYFGAYLLLRGFPGQTTAVVHCAGDVKAGRYTADHQGADVLRTATFVDYSDEVTLGQEEVRREAVLYLGPLTERDIANDLGGAGSAEVEAMTAVYKDQLGSFSFIGNMVLAALRTFHGFLGNWGWAIVLLTFCVRLLLFPINRRSQGAMMRHQEAMSRIKPKIEALQKKYEKDKRKFAEEQMKLMKQEKVPLVPLGGCLPILLQIPIFFGLFAALRSTIDLRQASWWWVKDLSQPDHLITFASPVANPLAACIPGCCGPMPATITGLHILPLLMTAAWVASSAMMPKPTTVDPQVEQQRKMMMFMPVVFGLMMYGYAAGLSLYWLTSSLVGIFETQVIKKIWPVKKPA